MSGLNPEEDGPHCCTCSCSGKVSQVLKCLEGMQESLQRFRTKRCQEIWENLVGEGSPAAEPVKPDSGDKPAGRGPKLELNDKTWAKIRSLWPSGLSSSLVKFMSSFICQTGRFEMGRSLFMINLETAARHCKFQLEQTLVEPEIRSVEDLCSQLRELLEPAKSLKSTQNVFHVREYAAGGIDGDDHMAKNDWIAVSKDASTLVYENTTTSTTPRDVFAAKLSGPTCLNLGVRKRPTNEGKSEIQLSNRFVAGEIHTFRRERSLEEEKAGEGTAVASKSTRPRRQKSQEDQVDRQVLRRKMLWDSGQQLGSTPTNPSTSTKCAESGSLYNAGLMSGTVSTRNQKSAVAGGNCAPGQKVSALQTAAAKSELGASKQLGSLNPSLFGNPGGCASSGQLKGKKRGRGRSNNGREREGLLAKEPKIFGEKLSVILGKLSVNPREPKEATNTARARKKD